MAGGRIKSRGISRIFGILGTCVIVCVILLLAPAVLAPVFGFQLYNVLTGSMEPEIPVGSVVVVKEMDAAGLETGDIITYTGGGLSGSEIVTHRVVENDTAQESLTTKGDANAAEDPDPVGYGQVVGKVVRTVPKLGHLLMLFSTFNGKLIALGGIGLGVVCFGVESLLRDPGSQKGGNDDF